MAHTTRTSPRVIIHALAAAASLFLMPAPAAAVQPPQIQLTGVVRDFRAYGDPGGHITMERPNMPAANRVPRWPSPCGRRCIASMPPVLNRSS